MRRPLAAAITLALMLVVGALAVGVQIAPTAQASAIANPPTGPAAVIAAAERETPDGDLPNEADMEFATMMIPHHRQAVELAGILAATPDVDDTSLGLAAFIERDQGAEIVQMQAWLDAWHQVGIMNHDHSGTMSGMATPDQIAELDALDGVAAEKRFLELMIAHHEGALEMARTVVGAGHNSFIRTLAKHIAAEQQREIAAMTARVGLL